MAAAGHTAIRTGELLASWDFLEQQPGQPDFSSLDTVFELAAQHDLQVLLGTGACCPPAWLRAQNPDLAIVDRDGVAYPSGAMWSWACINHPVYQEESSRFLAQLLDRYGSTEQLLGWQIHNEPGYPFIPREDRSAVAWYDYNEHTIAAFRQWLRERYHSIADLNAAWCWIPTNQRHTDFASVPAPRAPAVEWGSPNAWLDWRRFTYANWNACIHHQHEQIKAHSPTTVTMTNIYGAGMDHDGRLGIDVWSLAHQCDVIGYDLYPGQHMPTAAATGRLPAGNPDYPAWFLDFAASTARHAGRDWWLPELESGPLAGWAAGPQYNTTAADIRRWGLQALSRGTRMILFQGYREWPNLPMHWGGLADWEGEPTPRLNAASQLAELVAQHPIIRTATPLRAHVALLQTQDNTLFNASCGLADFVRRSMVGMHAILQQLQIGVEFVNPANLTTAHGYRVIILPFQSLVTPATTAALTDFTAAGGCIITMPRTAMVDADCQVWQQRPGGLTAVLGVTETSIEVVDEIKLDAIVGNKKFKVDGFHHQQKIALQNDVDVLATFANGDPAVTINKHGKGLAVHCATHLELAVPAQTEFWSALLQHLGVKNEIELDKSVTHLDCKLAKNDDGKFLLYAANSSAHAINVNLKITALVPSAVRNLWPVGTAALTADGNVTLELPPREALVAELS